ncbi:dUTP diphosphatase, partial [Holdemanella biformis]|uniref:dUTP diphosphatase n=1 Tax=Holdemanella biformis TaxID=1735 RepID=UPI00265E2437
MTSKDIELIKKMLQMQAKLDEAIMDEYGLEKLDEENLKMAILDEIGELTHELKANWCWWKKTQEPVDMGKVL